MDKIVELAKALKVYGIVWMPIKKTGRAMQYDPHISAKTLNYFKKRLNILKNEFNMSYTDRCDIGMTALYVRMNGDVLPCVHLNKIIGNITKTPLLKIWNSPELNSLRMSRMSSNKCPLKGDLY